MEIRYMYIVYMLVGFVNFFFFVADIHSMRERVKKLAYKLA